MKKDEKGYWMQLIWFVIVCMTASVIFAIHTGDHWSLFIGVLWGVIVYHNLRELCVVTRRVSVEENKE